MFDNITPVVKNLIILNVVVFAGSYLTPGLQPYLSLWFVEHPLFQVWQIFTHMFMHGGLMHIFFNMYVLLMFGPIMENWMGSKRFIFFYLASGIGAYLLTTGIGYFQYFNYVSDYMSQGYTESQIEKLIFLTKDSTLRSPMVGASGCIFGVLAGFAFLYPNLKLQILFIPVPIAAKWLIGAYVLYETLSTFGILRLQDNVGHAAHLGGAIFGFIMVWYWKRNNMDGYRID